MHPDQEALKAMMEQAGFDRVEYHNLTAGVVAVHVGRVYLSPHIASVLSPGASRATWERST